MKKVPLLGLVLVVLVFVGCVQDNEQTYYCQTGSLSTSALELISSNPSISAQQALSYCNQYAVANDQYSEKRSRYTRTLLERDLDQFSAIPGFSKSQFLGQLESSGAAFQAFTAVTGGYVYYYVEKE